MSRKIKFVQIAAAGILMLGCNTLSQHSYAPRSSSSSIGLSHGTPNVPELKRLANGHYRVTQPWTVKLKSRQWHIQKGYQSNGITAPDFIKQRMGDGIDQPETWSAVFHDWLFTQPGMTRALADQTFYDILIAYGVSSQKAELMYSTVRTYSLTKSIR